MPECTLGLNQTHYGSSKSRYPFPFVVCEHCPHLGFPKLVTDLLGSIAFSWHDLLSLSQRPAPGNLTLRLGSDKGARSLGRGWSGRLSAGDVGAEWQVGSEASRKGVVPVVTSFGRARQMKRGKTGECRAGGVILTEFLAHCRSGRR